MPDSPSSERWTLVPDLSRWNKVLPTGELWPDWHVAGPVPCEGEDGRWESVEVVPRELLDRLIEAGEALKEAVEDQGCAEIEAWDAAVREAQGE